MNKVVYSVLTMFLVFVTMNLLTGCNNVLIPEETHHYIHIVDYSPITPEIIMPLILKGDN